MKAPVTCLTALLLSACASAPPMPRILGGDAFAFTPEQCLALDKEQRSYKATQEAAMLASGMGAVLTGVFLAVFHGKESADVIAPALSTGVTSVAAGVGVFSGSQATSLEHTLAVGSCPR